MQEKEANKIVWWILSVFLSVALVFLTVSLTWFSSNDKDNKNRISTIETKIASLETINVTYNQRLDRIENKIDFLIQLRITAKDENSVTGQ